MSHKAFVSRRRTLRASLVVLFGILLAVSGACPVSGGMVGALKHGPRVVLVVGPAGDATGRYRHQADAAAEEARRYTDDVTTLYSPNATWPAVRAALQGASIVVYLGHGNGWPSRYRDSLFGTTQNGMGLNPVSGGGDDAHEYFGESYLSQSVRLAPGAIVLLHHLCYASGNSEPGLPEGTLDMAQQRVDNFAAGWLSTGARAVVAEGHLGPAYYVRSLLATRRAVEAVWRTSPSANGHVMSMQSARTRGATAYLDPDKLTAGFYRSMVVGGSGGQGGGGVQAVQGVQGVVGGVPPTPIQPSLARGGTKFNAPSLDAAAVAGLPATLGLQVRMGTGVRLPKGVQLSVRWTPIVSDIVLPGAGTSTRPSAGPTPGPSPSASPVPASPGPTTAPASPAAGDPSVAGLEPPEIDLVIPEAPDQVVEPAKAIVKGDALRLPLTAPASPGLYRLVTTIHDADGIAFDTATQSLIPALIVRVTPPLSAQYAVVSDITVSVGTSFDLPVRVLNSGRESWGARSRLVLGREVDSAEMPWLVARWLSLGSAAAEEMAGRTQAVIDPGENRILVVPVTAPAEPGEYLLVLDLDVPGFGPLAARGVAPALVRVHAFAIPPSQREPVRAS
jgi:hypothetical protein